MVHNNIKKQTFHIVICVFYVFLCLLERHTLLKFHKLFSLWFCNQSSLLSEAPSMSSLSSFVVLPSPDDQVLVQLKQLVDQCCNGKSYCKQVLSLYELSKVRRNTRSSVNTALLSRSLE